MAKSACAEEAVLGSLISVFRNHGFEGASLSRFTESSGLIKASLYHRFPAGKEQMALAALTEVDRIFATHVLAPADQEGQPRDRLILIAARLSDFYQGGAEGCLLETLSGSGTPMSVRHHVGKTLAFWIAKFMKLSMQSGLSRKVAKERAEGAVAAIEGALVISRVQRDNREFERTLASLPDRLLSP